MNSGIILKTFTHTYGRIPIIIAHAESDLFWAKPSYPCFLHASREGSCEAEPM